jgi:hypothetical protein
LRCRALRVSRPQKRETTVKEFYPPYPQTVKPSVASIKKKRRVVARRYLHPERSADNQHQYFHQILKGGLMATKSEVFKSKYLKHEDLNGGQVTLTIDSAAVELVGLDKEEKMVVYFKGGKFKPLILNSTNWDRIVDITGQADSDKWAGKKITIHVEKTQYRGKQVDGLRVVVPASEDSKKVGVVDQADDIPF